MNNTVDGVLGEPDSHQEMARHYTLQLTSIIVPLKNNYELQRDNGGGAHDLSCWYM